MVCRLLLEDNSETTYAVICKEVCREFNSCCCSIWLKEINGQQRLAYFEEKGSFDDLTISNLDFEVSKSVMENNSLLTVENLHTDRRFSGVKTPPLGAIGVPIVARNSVIGCIILYHKGRDNGVLTDGVKRIAENLAIGLDQVKYNFTTARQEKLHKELEIARSIQQSLLPKHMPRVQGIRLGARTIPAYEIGGDYYDLIITDDHITGNNNLGIAVGDVMGKGIPAALLMAVARTVIRLVAKRNLPPNEVLSEVNRSLFPDLSSQGMFLTMFYALYNPPQKALLYSTAGHNPPLILEGSSGKIGLLRCRGIFIGGRPELSYTLHSRKLKQGDIVLFYTDGLTEARNPTGERFDIRRVAEVLKEYRHCDVPALIDCLSLRLMQFMGETEQSDDITFVILKIE